MKSIDIRLEGEANVFYTINYYDKPSEEYYSIDESRITKETTDEDVYSTNIILFNYFGLLLSEVCAHRGEDHYDDVVTFTNIDVSNGVTRNTVMTVEEC